MGYRIIVKTTRRIPVVLGMAFLWAMLSVVPSLALAVRCDAKMSPDCPMAARAFVPAKAEARSCCPTPKSAVVQSASDHIAARCCCEIKSAPDAPSVTVSAAPLPDDYAAILSDVPAPFFVPVADAPAFFVARHDAARAPPDVWVPARAPPVS